jgi:hypothetical protein
MAKRKKLVTGVFSKDEVKILKKVFRSISTKEVAAKLGRKVKSVQAKASQLGLKKTKKYLKGMGLVK